MTEEYKHSQLTAIIIKAFYRVYNILGYGFLEKVYENALLFELRDQGIKCTNQLPVEVYYRDKLVGGYIADILVEDLVIVEIKAVEALAPIHETVLVNYLKGTGLEVGLLLNFVPKPEIRRRILSYEYLERIKTENPEPENDIPADQ